MASSSEPATITINLHRGGYFIINPLGYEFGMVSVLEHIDMVSMDYTHFVSFLESTSNSIVKAVFFLEPGKTIENGLKVLKCARDMTRCRQLALGNDSKIDIYLAHSDVDLSEILRAAGDSEYVEHDSDYEDDYISDCDDYFIYSSDEDDTTSLDHLSEGEDEIVEVRTIKNAPPSTEKKVNKPIFDDTFLTKVYEGLQREHYVEAKISQQANDKFSDRLGDCPVHNPNTKWKLMRPHLGERFESPDQLKRCLVFYALANGFKLYYKLNDYRRLLVKCSRSKDGKPDCSFRLWASWMQKEKTFQIKSLNDKHCCSRSYEFGSLVTCNWIARNFAKKIMTNPNMKVKDLQEAILKKYKCKVSIGQARRGKQKALEQFETCLQDHYGKLWNYAEEIITSNPGSTCLLSSEPMADGKNYFQSFYVCFKEVKQGWLEGCRKIIGIDGCFLKTICKGQLLSAIGRDGNNQMYPIAWAVVDTENKENWKWFLECLVNDLDLGNGSGLAIMSDQHKGIIEAAKEVIPLAHHRQCARHIYANFRKKFTGNVVYTQKYVCKLSL